MHSAHRYRVQVPTLVYPAVHVCLNHCDHFFITTSVRPLRPGDGWLDRARRPLSNQYCNYSALNFDRDGLHSRVTSECALNRIRSGIHPRKGWWYFSHFAKTQKEIHTLSPEPDAGARPSNPLYKRRRRPLVRTYRCRAKDRLGSEQIHRIPLTDLSSWSQGFCVYGLWRPPHPAQVQPLLASGDELFFFLSIVKTGSAVR